MKNDEALFVRIEAGLKRKLKDVARRERRSLAAQLETILENFFEHQAQGQKPAKGRSSDV